MLERGEKLDSLVDRSNNLSAQSKMFYKTAKKVCNDDIVPALAIADRILTLCPRCWFLQQNSCCVVM